MMFKAKGTDSKGKPMNINSRWAGTWVKMSDGKWQWASCPAPLGMSLVEKLSRFAVAPTISCSDLSVSAGALMSWAKK